MSMAELCNEYRARVESGRLVTRRGKTKKPSTTIYYTDRGRIERHIIPLNDRAPH